MKHLKLFENINKTVGYHITRQSNLNKIMKKGLEPRVPEDFGESGDIKGIYLFKTIDDCENALSNWFGERIEEWEEDNDKEFKESLIVVDLTGLDLFDSVEYEWVCLEHISPDRFLEVYKYKDFNSDIYDPLKRKYDL